MKPWVRLRRLVTQSLAAKLILCLVAGMVVLSGLFGYANLRLQQRHLEEIVLTSATRITDVIQRSTYYQMLRNDREALYQVITTLGSEPGMRRIRIFNEEGRISFSTDQAEVGKLVDKNAEACYACHSQAEPLTKLNRPDRARIFTDADGTRVLGMINPIENQAACYTAACHAHPADRKILGVIDADLSLAQVDAQISERQDLLIAFTVVAIVLLALVSVLFVWIVLQRPLDELTLGIQRVARGDLDHRLAVRSGDQLGALASSFNKMTDELQEARNQLLDWGRTLEQRVAEKSRELQQAYQHMANVEKMASLGKLAATVAHEVNNPLSGILTYAKLINRQLARGSVDNNQLAEMRQHLVLIESESQRCGEILRNLLSFARQVPAELLPNDLNSLIERCLALVRHQLELQNIKLEANLRQDLPQALCDAGQIQQVVLALVMNAIEAMPHGGRLRVETRPHTALASLQIVVADDGVGIPPQLLEHIFEPFFTTKENQHRVGLGLAIARRVIEQHHGSISVTSTPQQGTLFTIVLPAAVKVGVEEGVRSHGRQPA